MYVLSAAILGWFAWGSFDVGWVQSVALLMPVIWAAAPSRIHAGLIVMAYTSAASRGLISGIAVYFDTYLVYGFLLWLAANVLPGLAGFVCWHASLQKRVFLIPVLLLVLILPPVGLVGWAHPLSVTGWLMPGFGWVGLVLAVVFMMLLSYKAPVRNGLIAVVPMMFVSVLLFEPVREPVQWQGYNTHFHFGASRHVIQNPMQDIQRHWALQDQVDAKHSVHVFPETVGGLWNQYAAQEWQRFLESKDSIVLLGVIEPRVDGRQNNALVQVTQKGAEIVYRQRLPMPIGMWRPWAHDSTAPQWLQQESISMIAGIKSAIVMCYETTLMWPILHSLLRDPEVIVAVASTWWAPRSIHRAQHHVMMSWATLFHVQLVEAYNL